MKVLQLITRLDRGGAPRVFFNLIRGLNERGIKVVMASGPSSIPEEDPFEFSRRAHIPYHSISSLRRDITPLHDILALFEIINLLRKEKPDLLHTHTTKAGILGRVAGGMARTATVHTPHGHLLYGYFGKTQERVYISLEQLAARFCERIITISEDERGEYLKRGIGDKKKVITIHNGIDIGGFPGDGMKVRNELGITARAPLVGYVGRLEKVKGPHLFVKAALKIRRTYPQSHFLMAGDGAMKAELMKTGEGLPHLHILGHRDDAADVIAALDLLMIPSLNDGFNLAAVEGMASSIPIVATAVGGLPDVIGDAGILTRAGDVTRMAAEAVTLLKSPGLRKKLGEAGRRRAEEFFTLGVCLEKTVNLYHQIVAAGI